MMDLPPATLSTSYVSSPTTFQSALTPESANAAQIYISPAQPLLYPTGDDGVVRVTGSSTGKGILIGIASAFGSAALVAIILAIIFFFRYTQQGRIFLDRIGRPGEYDDEQAFAKEEAEALEEMDDLQRMEYMRAKGTLIGNQEKSRNGC